LKIKTKLTIEVIVLIALVGTVSYFAISSTRHAQENFEELNMNTMPALDNLKDMKLATTLLTSSTMEIMLIENQAKDAQDSELRGLEEGVEFELFQIENAKALFTKAINDYSNFLELNFPQDIKHRANIVREWDKLVNTSNKMILLYGSDASPEDILKFKDDFENAQQSVNQEIFSAISFTTENLDNRQNVVKNTIDSTIMSILIILNVFIVAALSIRYFILQSLTKPLVKLRKATADIAEGNFVKTGMDSRDEISELGRDIDKMSSELEKLNRDLISSERLTSIGSLASRLAHDLRNPLSVIKNSVEILRLRLNPYMDEKIDHQLAMIGRAVSRMSHQIEDVLDFVNIAHLKLETSSLITIIESAILSTDIPKSVKINMPKNSTTVTCDPYRLEVAISNLLKNASQAMDGKGEITIRILDKDNDVLIEIEDVGPGIPESEMDKIFEPLYTTKQTGTGLGLASCKSIVEKHGGTLTARNNPTTFTIQLPKKPSMPSKKVEIPQKSILHE
jgi:two-component system sensor histidine kinase HydH